MPEPDHDLDRDLDQTSISQATPDAPETPGVPDLAAIEARAVEAEARADAAEARALTALRIEAALAAGVPSSHAHRLVGSTPEELAVDAAQLRTDLRIAPPRLPPPRNLREVLGPPSTEGPDEDEAGPLPRRRFLSKGWQ